MSWFVIFLLFFVVSIQITNGLNPRKLDEGENKCGGCPCNKPCNPPSPPPPSPPPPSPPPPKSKPPSGYNCPPPPPYSGGGGGGDQDVPYPPNSQYIYMTGPPGDLYPVDHNVNSAKKSFTTEFSLLIGGFFLGLLYFW
ncbi:putative chaperone protein DnaJ 1-like [Capsicum annuum]|uniref:basic proline-rich protein n=1 Tax=Capsicum annuum TaxID=4072 RepID=UPI0007BEAA9F|nr:basic proline-rich protein [Capsicum annuum]KAF3622768.1 putative chaperone protein DnaJ 1-like [Capsicum annuum]